ncbi:MAG: thioredoxin fold domain-containing protein [Thermodesulfovibrionales bacterium]|nr:thioredoxin fold domain-containing protein [Thermodesulfovibrionales bacterium]
MRDDIAFYIKFLPLTTIHPEAYGKSTAIFCQEDNEKSLELLDKVFEKKANPKPDCKTQAVDESLRLGRSLGVNSTPTIVYQSGKVLSGAVRANELAEKATEK